MMKSILEAFADNHLNTKSDTIEKSEEMRALKEQKQAIFEKFIGIVGEEKRPLLEKWNQSQQLEFDFIERDTFLYGFRIGALTTLETYFGMDELIKSDKPVKEAAL